MNYKVSIVVPVYNVEPYLRKCMDSLVHQTLEKIEIIVVNDGSTDGSLAVLEEYQQYYPNKVRVYSTENRGVSHARNYGIAKATGEYMIFVDSDDWIEENMCEILYEKANRDGNDLVLCGRYQVTEQENNIEAYSREKVIRRPVSQNFSMSARPFEMIKITPFPWDKLYARHLYQKIQFPEHQRFEDLEVVYTLAPQAKSIGYVEACLYNYRTTSTGGFLNSLSEETLDIIKACEHVVEGFKKLDLLGQFHDEVEYLCIRHILIRFEMVQRKVQQGHLGLKYQLLRESKRFLDGEFPKWRENHYALYSSSTYLKRQRKTYYSWTRLAFRIYVYEIISPGLLVIAKKIWWKTKDGIKKILWGLKTPMKSVKGLLKKSAKIKSFRKLPAKTYTTYLENNSVNDKIILFESKHGEDLASNMFQMLLVTREEDYQDYEVYLVETVDAQDKIRRLLDRYELKHVKTVMLRSDEYLQLLATAKYLITDTSFPTYYIKREEQVYLNTWHGTPLKAMGRIVPGREYGLSNVQRNFLIADYLLYQQEFSRDVFMRDYMLEDIYTGEVLLSGYPRNSSFFREDRYEQIRRKLHLEDKQVSVYMPTWRGMLQKKQNIKQLEELQGYFDQLDQLLGDDQVVFIKLHPFVKKGIDCSRYTHIEEFPKQYETYDFLNASDCLITDYSSVMFDYGVSAKKIVLFTYDEEEYLHDRGTYIPFDEIELPKVSTVEGLAEELKNPVGNYKNFREEYCPYDNKNTARDVCSKVILGREVSFKSYKNSGTDREKVLIYLGVLKDNEKGNAWIRRLNELAEDDRVYYVAFVGTGMREHTHMIGKLDSRINYMILGPADNMTNREDQADSLVFDKIKHKDWSGTYIDSHARRECKKYFGEAKFDKIVLCNIKDYRIITILSYLSGDIIIDFADFSGNRYQRREEYRNKIRGILKGASRYTTIYVPPAMEGLQELKQWNDKVEKTIDINSLLWYI